MHHNFKLGNYTGTVLNDFARRRTLKASFPRLDEAELLKEIELGGYDLTLDTEMELHGNVLLIDTGEQKIMIDAGLPPAGGQLLQRLEGAGLAPSDIDMVLVTHGDGDHIGGLANYTNAKIVMPTNSYKLWTEDTAGMIEEFIKLFRGVVPDGELENMAAGRAKYAEVIQNLGDRVVLVEMGEEVAPGIKFQAAAGHRRDHTAVIIESNGETLMHVADAFRHPLQLKRHDFYGLFDSYPEQLAETMANLLAQAAETNALVFGAHFEFPALIRIGKEDGAYKWIV